MNRLQKLSSHQRAALAVPKPTPRVVSTWRLTYLVCKVCGRPATLQAGTWVCTDTKCGAKTADVLIEIEEKE